MADTPNVQVGDWIAWYQGGRLVYAPVRYMRKEQNWPWGQECLTDFGRVPVTSVVEVRRG